MPNLGRISRPPLEPGYGASVPHISKININLAGSLGNQTHESDNRAVLGQESGGEVPPNRKNRCLSRFKLGMARLFLRRRLQPFWSKSLMPQASIRPALVVGLRAMRRWAGQCAAGRRSLSTCAALWSTSMAARMLHDPARLCSACSTPQVRRGLLPRVRRRALQRSTHPSLHLDALGQGCEPRSH